MSLKYILIKKFCDESGYTEDAVQSKIKRGDWEEGKVWRKGPDNRRFIIVEGFYQWLEKQASDQPVKRA